MDFIVSLVIGLIAGALASRVVSGHGYGMVGDLVVGVVGALIGGWLVRRIPAGAHDFVAPLVNIRDIHCGSLRVLSQNRDSAARASLC